MEVEIIERHHAFESSLSKRDNRTLIAYTDIIMKRIKTIGEVLLVMCFHLVKELCLSRPKEHIVSLSTAEVEFVASFSLLVKECG